MNPGAQSHPVRRGRRASERPAEIGQSASGMDLSSFAHPATRTATSCARPTNRVATARVTNQNQISLGGGPVKSCWEMILKTDGDRWTGQQLILIVFYLKPTSFKVFLGFFDLKNQVTGSATSWPGIGLHKFGCWLT